MAFWQSRKRRRGGRQVYVYVMENGKQKLVPRKLTRHLDWELDSNVDYWVQQWGLANGERSRPALPGLHGRESAWAEGYLSSIMKDRGRSRKTMLDHKTALVRTFEYFVRVRGEENPNGWVRHSPGFAEWLRQGGAAEGLICRTQVAARGLWRWLREEGHVLSSAPDLRFRAPRVAAAPTPLPRTIAPEEILAWLASPLHQDSPREVKLLGALGYAFSLRPQESLGIRLGDFQAGTGTKMLAAIQAAHARLPLPSALAVKVQRQRIQTGDLTKPKQHSIGWVACIDARLAKWIVAELKELGGDDPEFQPFARFQIDWWFRLWKRWGIQGVGMKDLRRASALWLGEKTDYAQAPMDLMKHMRHRKIETTMLYVRRPEEKVKAEGWSLDLEA